MQNDTFKLFCVETGVKRLKNNITLDSKTCNDCVQYDGKVYDFGKELDLPRHPLFSAFMKLMMMKIIELIKLEIIQKTIKI